MTKEEIIQEIIGWAISIVIALCLAFLIKYYIGTISVVQQRSMYPTLQSEQRLWLDRLPRTFHQDYKVGQIVTFESPSFDSNYYISNESPKAYYKPTEGITANFVKNFLEFGKTSLIKRVIAKGGDQVKIEDGKVYVNGKLQDESYLPEGTETVSLKLTDFTVPEGYYFLLGDNRAQSTDSRVFGCVPKDKLEGKVTFSFYPLNTFGPLKGQ